MTTILYFFFFVPSDASAPFTAEASESEPYTLTSSISDIWTSESSETELAS
jgi:hypothetical protein